MQGFIDVIPVDHVVHATLAAMAAHAKHPCAGASCRPTVYQVATSVENPLREFVGSS